MRIAPFFVLAAVSGCVHSVHYPSLITREALSPVLVVRDVSVFAATGPEIAAHRDVVVRDGVIEAVVPTGVITIPERTRVLEGAGRTLLPGLVDMHAHVTFTSPPPWFKTMPDAEHNLQAHLFSGATTVYDTGADLDDMRHVRAQLATGAWVGPRMKFAGPIITRKGGYPFAYIRKVLPWPLPQIIASRVMRRIDSPAEGRKVVRELVDAHVDYVKVVVAQTPPSAARLEGDSLRAVVEAAHAAGKKVIAHIDTAENALIAAHAGVDALVHGVHSTPLTKEQAAELASLHVAVAPTLLTFERLNQASGEAMTFSQMERESEPHELLAEFTKAKGQAAGFRLDPELAEWMTRLQKHREERLGANTKLLYDAGVPILVGTDGNGSIGSFPGAIAEEMKMLHAAGVSNADVLLGATSRPAKFFDEHAAFGTIEPGKIADLLLVEGNPLEDLSAMSHIAEVVQRGRVLKRTPLAH